MGGGLARLISLLSLGVLLFALALSIGVISFVLDREHLEDLQTEHRIVLAVSIIIFFVTGCLAIRVAALCPRSSSNVESFNNIQTWASSPLFWKHIKGCSSLPGVFGMLKLERGRVSK